MKKVALYEMASSDDALSQQRVKLLEYVEKNPDWEVVLDAGDVVASRDNHERPGLQTIIDGIEANNVDVVLSVSMSRFSRKPKLAHETLEKIKERGADVICMDGSENAPFEDLEALSLEGIDEEFEESESSMSFPSLA